MMHELSIAMSIVDLVCEEAERLGADRVESVHLKLGALSGVVTRALRASFDMACADTPLAGSRLVIEEVPVVVRCGNCQADRPISSLQLFCCAVCGAPASDVVQGRELQVVAMEIPQ